MCSITGMTAQELHTIPFFLYIDFLPIFVWVLIQCQCYRAELEAEYMWGLVHPSLLNGEGGYYLTTLTSAVHVIKQLKFDNRPGTPINDVRKVIHSNPCICVRTVCNSYILGW